jgi:hypothetical protein
VQTAGCNGRIAYGALTANVISAAIASLPRGVPNFILITARS